LTSPIYTALVSDEESWLATSEGLTRLRGNTVRRFTLEDGLPDTRIRRLLATDDTVWIGTERGLVAYDRKADTIGAPVAELANLPITSLHVTADGDVWAGTARFFDEAGEPSGPARLGRFDGTRWQVWSTGEEPLGPEGERVDSIGSTAQGTIWVFVSNYGLSSMEGGSWRSWRPEDGAPNSYVLAFAARGEDMWMGGTMPFTLYRWNRDGWQRVEVNGLSGDVYSMRFSEDGALWAATSDGLVRLEKLGE
jgi:hypothetical protein